MLKENRKPGLPRLTKQSMEGAPDEKWVESVMTNANMTADEIERVRSKDSGIKLLENADVELHEVEIKVPDPWLRVSASAWTGGTLDQTAPYDKSYYMKRPDGVVEYRLFPDGVGVGVPFFTFPKGYRPSVQLVRSGVNSVGQFTSYTIGTDGVVTPLVIGAANLTFAATGEFMSSDPTPVILSCWPRIVETKLNNVAGVVVCDVADNQDSDPLPEMHGPVMWEITSIGGKKNVKLLNIPWLPYNRNYRVKLLFIGG